MDRRLKERLIGAAVLVALAVWLIPLILDGPPPTESADGTAALELPPPAASDAEPLRRQTIELDAQRRAASPRVETQREAAPSDAASSEAALGEAASSDAVPSDSATAPSASPPAPRAAPARAASTEPAPAGAESAWMVQLGSFGDEANAQRLADRVKTFGHDARLVRFAAGARTMYRVRVGPFRTRPQAEATASSLSAHGFPAQIVAPE